jgi:hypothetical protein
MRLGGMKGAPLGAAAYIVFMEKEMNYQQLETGCLYTIEYPPTEEKSDDSKDRFMKNKTMFSIIFLSTIRKFY